jgi:hypothetical protein
MDAKDELSGIYQMSFCTHEEDWCDWELFSDSKTLELPSEDGQKIIYFRVNDRAGNIAAPVTGIIYLNTTSSDNTPGTTEETQVQLNYMNILSVIAIVIIILVVVAVVTNRRKKKRLEEEKTISAALTETTKPKSEPQISGLIQSNTTSQAGISMGIDVSGQVAASSAIQQLPARAGSLQQTQQIPQLPPANGRQVTAFQQTIPQISQQNYQVSSTVQPTPQVNTMAQTQIVQPLQSVQSQPIDQSPQTMTVSQPGGSKTIQTIVNQIPISATTIKPSQIHPQTQPQGQVHQPLVQTPKYASSTSQTPSQPFVQSQTQTEKQNNIANPQMQETQQQTKPQIKPQEPNNIQSSEFDNGPIVTLPDNQIMNQKQEIQKEKNEEIEN